MQIFPPIIHHPLCQYNVKTSAAELLQTAIQVQHSAKCLPAESVPQISSCEFVADFLFLWQ